MAIRQVIRIDAERCDGCGQCIPACAEGAIAIVDGKARLVADRLCDGLGACLGQCPRGAIDIEEREAEAFVVPPGAAPPPPATGLAVTGETPRSGPLGGPGNRRPAELPVLEPNGAVPDSCPGGSCPSAALRALERRPLGVDRGPAVGPPQTSQLVNWPVQLRLVPPEAPFLRGADLLVCADCVPFAVPDFHARYLTGRAVVVGCPKLDDLAVQADRLQAIFAASGPRSITVLRMEVPCCSGLARAAVAAHHAVVPQVPLRVETIGIQTGAVVSRS